MKAHYSQHIRNLSVGDVATLRSRPRLSVHRSAKEDSDSQLPRYDSVQSLPAAGTKYSAFIPSTRAGCALRRQSRTAAESVYATPMQMENLNDRDMPPPPPPLPPPPFDFQLGAAAKLLTSSEVIPIVTKVHHTYANVSEAVQRRSAVESSFRPGESARLSSSGSRDVTDLAGSLTTAAGDAAGNGSVEADYHTELQTDDHQGSILTDRLPASANGIGSTEIDHQSSSSCHSVHSDASSSSSLSSHSSLSVLLTSTSSASHNTATHLLPPSLSPLANGVGLARKPPPLPPSRGAAKQAGARLQGFSREGLKNLDGNGSHHAVPVSVRQNSEVIEDCMPHRMLRKVNPSECDKHMMVAPLKIVREHSQMARITRRSFSENAVAANVNMSVNVDSTTSDDSDGLGFLCLAERARQEYIRRQALVGRQGARPQSCVVEHSKSLTQPPFPGRHRSPPITGGEYERLIPTRKKVVAVNGESVNRYHQVAHASCRNVRNSVANENGCRINQNQRRSETFLQKPGVHEHTTIASPVLSGKTSTGSEYELPDSEPHSDGPQMVILPPPPDFAQSNDGNLPSTDHLCSLDTILPPPPPEFTDSPNHIDSSANHVNSDYRSRPVSTWSVGDVTQWLDSIQMGCHRDSFVAHSVDGQRLVGLGRSELIGLGVSQVGQRMNLERAIKRAIISTPYCL